MKNIEQLLRQEEPEEKPEVQEETVLETVNITRYALEKAYAYARLTNEMFDPKEGIECGGYLITPRNAQDRIARDSYLARGQEVSGGEYRVSGRNVIHTGRELEQIGQKVLGWWHSHGHMSTFFSMTDDRGQLTVLNEIAPMNYVLQKKQTEVKNLEVLERNENKVVLHDPKYPSRKYELEVKGNGKSIAIPQFKVSEEKKIGFAYGIVVNDKNRERNPYAELATREYCFCCRNFYDSSRQVSVAVVDEGRFEIDEDELRKEIRTRVKRKKKFEWFGFSSYSGGSFKNDRSDDYSYGGYSFLEE